MTNEEILIICAVRYAQGRKTYITETVANILMSEIKNLSLHALSIIIDDLREGFNQRRVGDLKIDMPIWADLIKLIQEEQDRRKSGQTEEMFQNLSPNAVSTKF